MCRPLTDEFLQVLNKHWASQLEDPFHVKAAAIHPKFKETRLSNLA